MIFIVVSTVAHAASFTLAFRAILKGRVDLRLRLRLPRGDDQLDNCNFSLTTVGAEQMTAGTNGLHAFHGVEASTALHHDDYRWVD